MIATYVVLLGAVGGITYYLFTGQRETTVQGRVVSVSECGNQSSMDTSTNVLIKYCNYGIEYAIEGTVYRIAKYDQENRYKVGDSITVYYDTSNKAGGKIIVWNGALV